MDLLQLQPELRLHVPPNRAAQHTGAEVVVSVIGVAQHDSKVLGYVVQENMQGMYRVDDGIGIENAVVEDMPRRRVMAEREVPRISRAQELQRHFHQLFASQFAAREVVEDLFAMFRVEALTLGDSCSVVAFEFEPPVCF